MYTSARLSILGHGNEQLPNTIFKQEARSSQLAVVLPGFGYRCNQPLLWYPSRILLSLGADVLWVEYTYDGRQDWAAAGDEEQRAWLFDDVDAATKAVMDNRYERVTVIAKSLGTLALGHLLASKRVPDEAKLVWLTPVLSDPGLRSHLEGTRAPSLVVIGTNDHFYDRQFIEQLRRNEAIETLEIEGADHMLETSRSVVASVDILKCVIEAVQRFVSE